MHNYIDDDITSESISSIGVVSWDSPIGMIIELGSSELQGVGYECYLIWHGKHDRCYNNISAMLNYNINTHTCYEGTSVKDTCSQ